MVKNKKILIVGLANKYSIASSIAKSLHENGAKLGLATKMRDLKNLFPLLLRKMVTALLKYVIFQVMSILKN